MPTKNKSEILPWDPSPLEKQRQWLQDKMLGIGSFATEHNIPFLTALGLNDPYYTRGVAENLTFASEFLPGFGDIQGVREGKHMMEEGQPKLGAAMMALSAVPFVPFTPIKKALQRGLQASPTKVVRTNTGDQAVSDAANIDDFINSNDAVEQGASDALREGRLRYETNAERQLLSNPDYPDPTKAYNIDDFINSTVANSPIEIQTTVRNQLDEWVSPDLRGSTVTTQELLDDIGKNKPTIQENYMADTENPVVSKYSQYMPNIPTNEPYPNPLTALNTIHPNRYTERSFSIHSPKHGKLFDDPGHREVSQGTELRQTFDPSDDVWNISNRIFTTRAGMYDIDGVKTYIPAEGQSGVYRMGTSGKQALSDVTTQGRVSPDTIESMLHGSPEVMEDITRYLDNPYPIELLDHTNATLENIVPPGLPSKDEFLRLLGESGHTLDEWNALVKEQREYMAKRTKEILAELTPTRRYAYTDGPISMEFSKRQAQNLAEEDSTARFVPQFTRMIAITEPGVRKNLPTSAPLFKEWFPLHMKTSLNDAVEHGADVVRFPINAESVAKQMGHHTPEEGAENLGKIYKKRTDEGIKRIEAEYGIKLNPTEITDDNNNIFLEIVLTPELKEAFETIVFNRGGAVYKKPLMNLKY